jgi:GAF domain-containing protein
VERREYWFTNNVRSNSLVFEVGLDELAEKTGVLKTLIAVLSAGGRRLGVVQASNKLNGEDFTENDARLLLIFATQAAAIIENARLYREVQRSAEQAQALRRIAELAGEVLTTEETFTPVLAETARLTDSALVFINVLDKHTGSLITYPRWAFGVELNEPIVQDTFSPGFQHSVAVSHNPFFSNDVPNHSPILPSYKALAARFNITNAILAPLVVGDRSLGELGIANRADRDYTEEDLGVLHTVAAQIAAALDRLLRYQATGQNLIRRNEELDVVSRVSNELTLTLDLDRILDVIRTEAARAAKAEGSTVALLQPVSEWRAADRPEMERRIGEVGLMPRLGAPVELEVISRGADTVLVTDYEHHDLEALPPQARSALAAAIMYVDQVVGVIHLFHSEPNRFDHQAAAFLMTLSTKAALGYGNAIRFQEQVERSAGLRRRVEQLNQIFELGHVLQSNTDPAAILESIAYGVQQGVGFDTVLMLRTKRLACCVAAFQAGLPIDVFEQPAAARSRLAGRAPVQRGLSISQSYFFPMEKGLRLVCGRHGGAATSFEGSRTTESRGRHCLARG